MLARDAGQHPADHGADHPPGHAGARATVVVPPGEFLVAQVTPVPAAAHAEEQDPDADGDQHL